MMSKMVLKKYFLLNKINIKCEEKEIDDKIRTSMIMLSCFF
jgi:hypothetical protein